MEKLNANELLLLALNTIYQEKKKTYITYKDYESSVLELIKMNPSYRNIENVSFLFSPFFFFSVNSFQVIACEEESFSFLKGNESKEIQAFKNSILKRFKERKDIEYTLYSYLLKQYKKRILEEKKKQIHLLTMDEYCSFQPALNYLIYLRKKEKEYTEKLQKIFEEEKEFVLKRKY